MKKTLWLVVISFLSHAMENDHTIDNLPINDTINIEPSSKGTSFPSKIIESQNSDDYIEITDSGKAIIHRTKDKKKKKITIPNGKIYNAALMKVNEERSSTLKNVLLLGAKINYKRSKEENESFFYTCSYFLSKKNKLLYRYSTCRLPKWESGYICKNQGYYNPVIASKNKLMGLFYRKTHMFDEIQGSLDNGILLVDTNEPDYTIINLENIPNFTVMNNTIWPWYQDTFNNSLIHIKNLEEESKKTKRIGFYDQYIVYSSSSSNNLKMKILIQNIYDKSVNEIECGYSKKTSISNGKLLINNDKPEIIDLETTKQLFTISSAIDRFYYNPYDQCYYCTKKHIDDKKAVFKITKNQAENYSIINITNWIPYIVLTEHKNGEIKKQNGIDKNVWNWLSKNKKLMRASQTKLSKQKLE